MGPNATPPPRPSLLDRALNQPLSPHAFERDLKRDLKRHAGPLLTLLWLGGLTGLVCVLGYAGYAWLESRAPLIAPQHRAEALCFLLAQPPVFDPPMPVEPNAARVPGHFPASAPPAYALQQSMGFSDEMVIRQRALRAGDFDVTAVWLRIPDAGGAAHWLVLGWLEDGALEVASFRFGERGPVIEDSELVWGERLIARLVIPENFDAAVMPSPRVRMEPGSPLPRFGPRPR